MDRNLSSRQRRARWVRPGRRILLAAILVTALGWSGQHYLRPSLQRMDLRIATVERGPLEATVSATGTVVPSFEQTLSSPISAEISDVFVSLGERVARGQAIMQLDTTASALALSSLEEQLALNRAERRSRELQLADSIRQSRSRRELLEIDLESRRVRRGRLEQLADSGAISADELLEAKLNVKRTEVELEQVADEILNLEARREADLERLELERSMLDRQRADQARRVEMATVTARFDGVVTRLVQDTGGSVTEGQALATIAAEGSFGIEAALSDFYAPQLKLGQRAKVRSSSGELAGRLRRLVPAPDEPLLVLFVELDEPDAPFLAANLRVDVDVVTDEKHDVLKLRRGPALESAGIRELYVIEADRAIRRLVRLGLSSTQSVEIVEGLRAGDEVIISDMRAYEHLADIRIR